MCVGWGGGRGERENSSPLNFCQIVVYFSEILKIVNLPMLAHVCFRQKYTDTPILSGKMCKLKTKYKKAVHTEDF